MKNLFDHLPLPEPSSLVGFAQNRLVRDAESRDEKTMQAALEEQNARFLVFNGGKVLVHGEASNEENAQGRILLLGDEVSPFNPDLGNAILLGTDPTGPVFACRGQFDEEKLADPFSASDVRSLLYWSSVGDEQASIAAQGSSMLAWHENHRFCGKCGSKNEPRIGGYKLECPSCGHLVFPRTDPVVIMLATKGNKCLLARSPHFPEKWYSTLAGFMEPGETIEDAVRREVAEESGISVGRVRYHASQPWPFPHSLMIGVMCEALSEEINMDAEELEDCQWFTHNEVRQMRTDSHPQGFRCPPGKAIASHLIGNWVDELDK